MKKYFPVIILVFGIVVLVAAFVIIRGRGNKTSSTSEEITAEIPFDKRPVTSLTPSEDGHWLKLKIDKLLSGAKMLDYELLYNLPDGRTQGVPGSVTLGGLSNFERRLLLGSESSGKFRYDEGVEKGTLTLKFRDEKGKLMGKLSTDFHLQSVTDELSSLDNKFKYLLDKKPKKGYFVVMETFGVYSSPANLEAGPYGVFSSLSESLSGKVTLGSGKINLWQNGSWVEISGSKSSNIGVFISSQ